MRRRERTTSNIEAGDANDDLSEFLTTFTLAIPVDASARLVEDAKASEAQRTHQLAEQGHLGRLWMLPGEGRSLGLWRADGRPDMDRILASLPLASWLTVDVVALSRHPSDPGS